MTFDLDTLIPCATPECASNSHPGDDKKLSVHAVNELGQARVSQIEEEGEKQNKVNR